MVAIVTGQGLGLERSSALVLGSRAQLGSSSLGRTNESVYVNAANGNLILTNRDEVLIGRGPDSFINRTYNSQGLLDDDNGDNWRISTHRRVYGLTGTLNQAGSTVRRVDWDGSDVKYQWNGTSYVSTAGSGAYDTIKRADANSATPWIWTDGDSQFSERYDAANGGRITERWDTERDSSGNPTNKIIYSYDASGRLNRVTTADGNFTDLVWDNTAGKTNNLLMLTTSYTDTQTNTTKYLTRTRYTYDASNRLETVIVDLTPEHASGAASGAIADGRVYATTYSYDGTSRRIASITQTDGTLLQFTYVLLGSGYRISTFVQTAETGVTRTTSFVYDTSNRTTAITDPANVVTSITYDSAFNLVRQSVAPVAGGAEQITTYAYVGGATNLLLRSAELNNASWVGTSVTILANDPARPTPNGGTSTAERLTFTGTNNKLVQNLSGLTDGVRYLADIWVYSATATTVKWGLLQGTQSPATFAVAAGVWTRLRAELIYTAGSTSRRVELAGVNGGVIWATQAQVRREAESDLYVETAGSAIIPTIISDDVTIIRRFDGASNAGADNWSEREDFTYDARGNLIKRGDGTGNTTEYSYTAANQRETATQYLTPDPDGVAGSGVASNPIVTRYVYDDAGNNGVTDQGSTYVGSDITDVLEQHLRFLVSAEGRVTEYRYNAEGQLIAIINYAGNAYTGPTYAEKALSDWVGLLTASDQMQAQRVDYIYDFRGSIQQETQWSRTTGTGAGDAGQDWSRVDYIYDQYGLLLRKLQSGTAAGFVVPNPVSETYVYDGMGRVISFKDSGNYTTTTSYLDAQSKTLVAFANGAITTSRYNRAGELVSSVETTGVTQLNVLPASITGWNTSGEFNGDGSGGPPRSRITIKNNTHYSVTSSPTNVVAGDQITWRITLRQLGTLSTTELWAWATGSNYGTADLSSARIVDGPGNIAQSSPGKFTLQGLSQSDYTTIEVTRIFTQAESYTPQIYTYMGSIPSGNSQGIVVVNDMAVTKTSHTQTLFKYDNLGRLRVVVEPTGVKSHFLYDQLGRKVGEVDSDGSLTEYKYDATDRIIASVRYATAVSATNLTDLGDPNTTKTIANIRPSSLSTDRWSWSIYDKAGQLIQTIDAAGAVAVLSYDGAGRLTSTMRYATALPTNVVNGTDGTSGYRTTPPAQVVLTLPAADAGKDRIARSYFDNDGLLIGSVDAENFVTEYFYDKAGRKVGTIGYANATSTAISASTLWSAVKSGIIADSAIAPKNIHNYWLYDGRGLVGAMVDGEGNVIRYAYSAQGQVFRETIGNKVDIAAYIALSAGQRTLADLDTRYIGSPVLDVTNFEYDVRNLVSKRQRMLAASKVETTDYVYDSMGRLVSETVSETGSADTRTQRSRYDLGGRLIGSLGGVGSATLSTTPTDAQLAGAIALYGTRYVYDAVGRITQKITPQGTDATGIKTVYYYDQDGQLRYEVNALGEVTEYKYDVLEDRTEVIVYGTRMASPSSLTGGLLTTATLAGVTADAAKDSRTQFEYDNRALLKASKGPLWTSSAPGLDVINNQYNSFGELDASWHMPQSDQADRTETLYNRRGLQSTVTRLLNGVATGAVVTGYSYDAFARLTRQDDNLTLGRGVAYEYDRAGRLTKEWENPDKSGGYRRFVYDTRSNQIELYDHGNNKTSFQFDQFNRTIVTTTPGLIATTVEQNAYGQTIEITTPGTYFENGLPRTTTYSYDKNGNVLSAGDGIAITTTIYDNAGRVKESKSRINATSETLTKITFDAVGRVYEEIKDPTGLNLVTRYEYDAMGQQIRITDARNVVTRIDYDLAGQKVRVVQDEGAGKLNLTTDFTYRADSKVETVIEGVGTTAARTTKYEYDSMGRLERERVDPYGLNVTTRSFYDVNNNIVAVEDELNFKTHFVYDKENRQMLSVGAEGEVVETGYDAEGRVAWTLAYAKRIAASTVAGWTPGVSSTDVTNGLNAAPATLIADRIVRTIYDKDGRRAYAIDGEGFVTYFKYHGANSITATRVYEQAYLTGAHSQSALDLYYGNGTAPAQPSRLFAETRFAYDKANRLISTVDAENFGESYEYDDVGNRTKLTNKLGGIANYVYDAVGRLTHEKISATTYDVNGTPRNGEFTKNHYVYDAVGNLKDHYEAYGLPEQRLTSYTHDNANRMLSKTGKAFNGTLVSESYQYDARGNVTLVSGPMDAKTYSRYDAANRRVEQVVAVNGTQGALTRWTYFATGEVDTQKSWSALVSLSDAANGTVSANPAGTVRETRFEYDRNGQLVAQKIPNIRIGAWNGTAYVSAAQTLLVAVQYAYDAFGNVVKETDGNGNETHHWYDRNGRETRKLDAEGYVTTWARDEDGNVTSERRFAVKYTGGLADIAGHPTHGDDRVTSFEYDKNGQRKSETRLGVGSYTVSATGALSLGQSDAGIQYAYNGLGLVTQKTEANGDIVKSDYDSYGRLNWQRDPGFTDFGGFTAHHQTSFYYDALGNLVRSVENGVSNTGGALASYGTGTERVTRYQHQNGFLAWQEDATSFRTSFDYDLAGRATVSDRVERQLSGGGTQAEATRRAYDAAGRVTSEQRVTISGTIETSFGPGTIYTYNAFGEVDAKLVGGVTVEQFTYDSASRVIKTNSGDGTWKFFVYDGNGNATLTLSARGQLSGSTTGGIDVSGYDQLAAYNSVTGGASSLALTSFAQSALLASVAAYDKRNMATASHEPGREATGATQTISRSQTYNAFGEVASETDARGYTADYSYNKMGRVVRKIAAAVQMTRENGETVWIRPAEDYYYDLSGRLVGTRDAQDLDLDSGATFDWSYDLTATAGTNSANAALKKANRGYLTTRILLAGTGHEGSEALIVSEYRPDSSVWSNGYDAFGDARRLSDGLNRITTQGFDKAGRVTQITRPATTAGTLIDSYAYDGLGRKLTAWNSLYGVSDAATTDYDALGRVISQRAQGGDVTTISYAWNAALASTDGNTATLWSYGGWEETTTYANGKSMVSKTDSFGREVEKTDMGGNVTRYRYDQAGRQIRQDIDNVTLADAALSFAYFNTGQLSGITGPSGTASYGYDAGGNRLSEQLVNAGITIKNQSATYDALGRLMHWEAAATATAPAASIDYEYDAVSNIRKTTNTSSRLNAQGTPYTPETAINWFRFDAVNRLVTDRGQLSGAAGASTTTIVRSAVGRDIMYDAAGQRKSVLYDAAVGGSVETWVWNPGEGPGSGGNWVPEQVGGEGEGSWQWVAASSNGQRREDYVYDAAGRVIRLDTADSSYSRDRNLVITTAPPPIIGTKLSEFSYDLLGQQKSQIDWRSGGLAKVYERTANYNSKGQVTDDFVTNVRPDT